MTPLHYWSAATAFSYNMQNTLLQYFIFKHNAHVQHPKIFPLVRHKMKWDLLSDQLIHLYLKVT